MSNPAQTWQPPNNSPNPTPNTGAPTIPLILGMPSATSTQTPNISEGTSNRDNRPRPDPFNGAYPVLLPPPTNWDPGSQNDKSRLGPFHGAHLILSPPTQSTSSGTLVFRALNGTNPDPTQTTKPDDVWTELSPLASPKPRVPHLKARILAPLPVIPPVVTKTLVRTWTMGTGGDEVVMGDGDTQSSNSFGSPPPTSCSEQLGTRGLRGCSNPTFVDPRINTKNLYRSWKHKE